MTSYNDDEEKELIIETENTTDNATGDLEEMMDKTKAGAKAMGNEMKDTYNNMETEYDKEKAKEDIKSKEEEEQD